MSNLTRSSPNLKDPPIPPVSKVTHIQCSIQRWQRPSEYATAREQSIEIGSPLIFAIRQSNCGVHQEAVLSPYPFEVHTAQERRQGSGVFQIYVAHVVSVDPLKTVQGSKSIVLAGIIIIIPFRLVVT